MKLMPLLIICAATVAPLALAGNAEMMENRARQLIELSNTVAQQVTEGKIREGRITFEARVVQPPEGDPVIVIDRVHTTEPTEPVDEALPPAVSPMSVIPSDAETVGSGAALDPVRPGSRSIQQILDENPKARILELNGSALEGLSRDLSIGAGGGYLIYW